MIPAPIASEALPENPAKKRRIIKDIILLAKPQPIKKHTNITFVIFKMIARPYNSDKGAQSSGPAAYPYHQLGCESSLLG
jgi:hypothetical protein